MPDDPDAMPDPDATPDDTPSDDRGWLSAGVASVGATSFLSDAGHEITTAVLPSFLTATLHASAGALGLIEGVSDALTGVMALIGGPLANDQERRGRLASGGYLGTALATGAIGLAATVWQAGALRAVAWLSRGLRSPARDSLLASLAPRGAYGRAFGLERTGDNLGAVAGPLMAAGLVAWIGIRPAMWCAAIPGLFAAVTITIAAREARRRGATGKRRVRFKLRRLHAAGLLRPLIPVLCFELGNVATTLLILRSTQLLTGGGRSATAATSLAILIYAAHNAVGAVVATLGGHWIDRAGPRVVLFTGAVLYVIAYAGFAFVGGAWLPLLIAFSLAGSGIGLAETAQSTLVARLLPDDLRGSGFGVLGGIRLIGDFCSSAVVGLLYAALSPTAGFTYAAAWMLLAAIASLIPALAHPHGRTSEGT
jgi:MFS family permease